MTVYVDDMKAPFTRMIMSHMIADTSEELLEMVDKIGVQRKWIQDEGSYREHFDISQTKRNLAIREGAVEVSVKELSFMLQLRQRGHTMGDPKTAKYRFYKLRGWNMTELLDHEIDDAFNYLFNHLPEHDPNRHALLSTHARWTEDGELTDADRRFIVYLFNQVSG